MALPRPSIARLALPGALALLSTLSCSDDDPKETAATRFMERYAEIYCTGAAPCCAASGSAHDVGACEQFIGVFGRLAALDAKHFDQAAADQCLAELQASLATCNMSDPDVCDRVLSGNASPGQPCDGDYDCALPATGVARCDFTSTEGGEVSGVCKSVLPGAEGTSCAYDQAATQIYECDEEDGLHCDYATDTCHALVAIGQACSSGGCVAEAFCDSVTQKCVARKAIGEACSFSSDCVETAGCTGGSCVAKKAVGEACTTSSECQGFCDSETNKCVSSGMSFCVTYE